MKSTTKNKLVAACFLFILLLQRQHENNRLAAISAITRRRQRNFTRNLAFISNMKNRKPRRKNKIRSFHWWEEVVLRNKLSEEEWLENFRVSQNTFMYLCDQLREVLAPQPNILSQYWKYAKLMTVEKKVAVSLYFLASCAEYRVIGNQFGIQKSTVCKVVYQFVNAVNKILTPKHIRFPNSAEAKQSASLFQHKSKIPNIIGAIDGTHIPILPPSEGYRDFINRKGWASWILQGIVDAKYKFIDISIKQPGRSHDFAALLASNIYKNIDKLLPKETVSVNGEDLPYVIIGDPAYPLLPWLLKSYSGPNLTPIEESFNVHMNSARVAIEIAFGRLKARWRCLMKRNDMHFSFVPEVIATCCTLHNIVETFEDKFMENWTTAVEELELTFEQPGIRQCPTYHEFEGYISRICISEYLAQNFPLRRTML
ncbi:unnamed protein product [Ceutorhynchus assimilis]|uniref:DDE Tnp4 domain-containing protein n=1 Tax=Ceutorhynchus assimilis TaxID=467358 RepID=A0A9N9MKN8_9CUCU|nr:unnamed protein product [Ceutorhynchus assimilis]